MYDSSIRFLDRNLASTALSARAVIAVSTEQRRLFPVHQSIPLFESSTPLLPVVGGKNKSPVGQFPWKWKGRSLSATAQRRKARLACSHFQPPPGTGIWGHRRPSQAGPTTSKSQRCTRNAVPTTLHSNCRIDNRLRQTLISSPQRASNSV